MKLGSLSRIKSTSRSPSRMLKCEVILLDPTQSNFKTVVNSTSLGQVLFDEVCEKLGAVLENDYLGLRYLDKHGQKQWLELNKEIYRQVKGDLKNPRTKYMFSLRFKHYPKKPQVELKQELSKYLLYLQLRRDLYRGRLVGNSQEQYILAALVLQAETGEYDIKNFEEIQMADLKVLPHMNKKVENQILTFHENYKNMSTQEAENVFIDKASQLETYGVEPIPAKDQKGNELFVGITNDGVSTFNGTSKTHTFLWQNIPKISYSHRLFMFEVVMNEKKHILGFKCDSTYAACALWKWALDKKYFFTLEKASYAKRSRSGGSLFRRKKTYSFYGRSQRELNESCLSLQTIPQPHVSRTQSMMTLLRTTGNRMEHSMNGPINDYCIRDGFATLPHRAKPREYLSNNTDSSIDYQTVENVNNDVSNKEQKVKHSNTAKFGAVLDFMSALKETPILKRVSKNNNADNRKNYSPTIEDVKDQDFDKEEAAKVVSEMVEIAVQQRAKLCMSAGEAGVATAPTTESTGSTAITPINATPDLVIGNNIINTANNSKNTVNIGETNDSNNNENNNNSNSTNEVKSTANTESPPPTNSSKSLYNLILLLSVIVLVFGVVSVFYFNMAPKQTLKDASSAIIAEQQQQLVQETSQPAPQPTPQPTPQQQNPSQDYQEPASLSLGWLKKMFFG